MGQVYEASFSIAGLTTSRTLMWQTAPADAITAIMSAHVTNATNETNEQFEVVFQRITTLSTPTSTAVVPGPKNVGYTTSGVTMEANVTSGESTYPSVNVQEAGKQGAASLGGWHFEPPPDERFVTSAADNTGLRLLASVTAFDAKVTWTFDEIGG